MSNFDSFSYFQTSLSLGVKEGLQKLPKYDINDLRLLFYCYILIPRKCSRKTPFKTQCPPPEISDIPTALLKFRGPILRVLNTCQDLIDVKIFDFCAHSVRLLNTKFKAKHCWSNQTNVYELKICLV